MRNTAIPHRLADISNRPLLSLTLQVSRSLLLILPTPPPPTLSPLHSPLSLILRYRYLTPLLMSRPSKGHGSPFSNTHTRQSPPWVQQAGVTPVDAPGTTPLRPSLLTQPLTHSSRDHRDIRDFNPIDPDLAKGKGKGKGKPADKGKGKGKKGQGKGQGKGKGKPKGKEERSSTPPPAIYAPAAKGKGKK